MKSILLKYFFYDCTFRHKVSIVDIGRSMMSLSECNYKYWRHTGMLWFYYCRKLPPCLVNIFIGNCTVMSERWWKVSFLVISLTERSEGSKIYRNKLAFKSYNEPNDRNERSTCIDRRNWLLSVQRLIFVYLQVKWRGIFYFKRRVSIYGKLLG